MNASPDRPRAVVVRADHIGDLLLTTPVIRALARAGWEVDVVAPAHVCLLEGNPSVRRLAVLSDICPAWPRDWPRLAGWLRRGRYHAVLLPFARPWPLLAASVLSGARKRIAMWGGIAARLTGHHALRSHYFDRPRPYAEIIGRCLEPLSVPLGDIHPEIFLTADDHLALHRKAKLPLPGPEAATIGVHPFALGNACNLPWSAYRDLIDRLLASTALRIVLTGTQADRNRMSGWEDLAQSFPDRLWNAAGELSLRETAALIASLRCYVVPSTGPLHIAASVGTPTVAPFCPQVPVNAAIWGHASPKNRCLEPESPPCHACERHTEHCDFRGSLPVERIMAAVLDLTHQ